MLSGCIQLGPGMLVIDGRGPQGGFRYRVICRVQPHWGAVPRVRTWTRQRGITSPHETLGELKTRVAHLYGNGPSRLVHYRGPAYAYPYR